MNDLYCPYCDAELGNHFDDRHEPNVNYEHKCSECGKNFIYSLEYYPSFTANKADCLNGAEHDYKEICGYPKEYFENKRRCTMCGKEITLQTTDLKDTPSNDTNHGVKVKE